jgi:VanZ family protein
MHAPMLKYFIRYKFSILVASFIVFLSLIPASRIPDSAFFDISFLDKIVHFCMYAFLGWVALLEKRCPYAGLRPVVFLLLSIFILSTLIEVLQATVVSTRSAEWLDLFANMLGLIFSYFAYRIFLLLRS